jgi:hypothetical protein
MIPSLHNVQPVVEDCCIFPHLSIIFGLFRSIWIDSGREVWQEPVDFSRSFTGEGGAGGIHVDDNR